MCEATHWQREEGLERIIKEGGRGRGIQGERQQKRSQSKGVFVFYLLLLLGGVGDPNQDYLNPKTDFSFCTEI